MLGRGAERGCRLRPPHEPEQAGAVAAQAPLAGRQVSEVVPAAAGVVLDLSPVLLDCVVMKRGIHIHKTGSGLRVFQGRSRHRATHAQLRRNAADTSPNAFHIAGP